MKFLEVTTNVGCPVKCGYCPQDVFLKAYGDGKKSLGLADFTKVLEEKLPEGCEVGFSGFSEPWKNRHCTEMVKRAFWKMRPLTIYTTLVGMKMRDVDVLRDLSFKTFCIHLPGTNSHEKIPITPEYLDVLGELVRSIPGITFAVFGPVPKEIADVIGDRPFATPEMMTSRCGLVPNCGKAVDKTGPIRCQSMEDSDILDHNVLLPDGRVAVCCMDFGMKYVLGNLFEQSYEYLFIGKVADKIRAGLRGEKQILCHKCEYGVSA